VIVAGRAVYLTVHQRKDQGRFRAVALAVNANTALRSRRLSPAV
jgi:hypothetical protein